MLFSSAVARRRSRSASAKGARCHDDAAVDARGGSARVGGGLVSVPETPLEADRSAPVPATELVVQARRAGRFRGFRLGFACKSAE